MVAQFSLYHFIIFQHQLANHGVVENILGMLNGVHDVAIKGKGVA